MYEKIWEFKTARFTVSFEAGPEYDLDLSWDETGETREGLESGRYIAFVAKVAVYLDGLEIGQDYLGGCIYENAEQFRDHLGIRPASRKAGALMGSYFSNMVRQAIKEARKFMASAPQLRKERALSC